MAGLVISSMRRRGWRSDLRCRWRNLTRYASHLIRLIVLTVHSVTRLFISRFIYGSFDNSSEAFVITSTTVGHGLHHALRVGQGFVKNFSTNLMNFFRGIRCVIGNRWLDFGGHPDHGADTGIFKRYFIWTTALGYLTFGTDWKYSTISQLLWRMFAVSKCSKCF